MEELDKNLQKQLRDAERNAVPDYPNWKRGIGCGTVVLICCILLSVLLSTLFAQKSYWGINIGLMLIFTLIAVGVAAFRPQK